MARRTYRLTDGQCAALLLRANKPGGAPPRYARTWLVLSRLGLVVRTSDKASAWRLTDEGRAVAERIAGSADA